MRLLVFNLAMDLDHPALAFTGLWVEALAWKVTQVDVITMSAGRMSLPANVRVFSIGRERGLSKPRCAFEFYRVLVRLLREARFDGCFSHTNPLFSAMAGPLLRAWRVPMVTWYAHASVTLKLKLAHFWSARMVASLADAYPYKREKLSVIGQAIDTELFSPQHQPLDPPLVLFAGRLSPVKDHPTFLRACARLRGRWPQLHFNAVILGSPMAKDHEYAASLLRLRDELGLQDCLEFVPAVGMTDLAGWYNRCTVHVNGTATGSGDKVVWESMSCGRVTITANEGLRTLMGRYTGELLYPHGSAEALADRLHWALTIPAAERNAIGLALREQVVRQHSLDTLADRLFTAFARVSAWPVVGAEPSQRVTV